MSHKNYIYSFLIISLALAGDLAAAPPTRPVSKETKPAWQSVPSDQGAWRREPFKRIEDKKPDNIRGAVLPLPKIQHEIPQPDIELHGIMSIDNSYYAVINGRTFKPGDRIGELTINEISRYQVTLNDKNGQQIYDIYQGRIDRGKK